MMYEGFQEVEYKDFCHFIMKNDLVCDADPNNGKMISKSGELMAYKIHGIAFDMYYIKSELNYEGLKLFTNLINKKSP